MICIFKRVVSVFLLLVLCVPIALAEENATSDVPFFLRWTLWFARIPDEEDTTPTSSVIWDWTLDGFWRALFHIRGYIPPKEVAPCSTFNSEVA